MIIHRFCFVISLLGLAIPAGAEDIHFSSHKHDIAMPQTWVDQTISYDTNAKNADLVISLGQQTYPVLNEAIKKYAADNRLKIVINEGSCGISAGRLIRKKVDIAAFCCPPGKTDRLPGLKFHTVAIAPIALITHKDNPLSNVSLDQARKIFSGKHRKWDELVFNNNDYKGMQISPVGRLHCKVRPGHWRALLDDESRFSSSLFEVGVIPDMLVQIKNKRQAIGYETAFMIRHHKLENEIKTLRINGQSPHEHKSLLAGKYPLYRTYNLTTWSGKHNKKLANSLIEYVIQYIEQNHDKYEFVPKSKLVKAGWKFSNGELVGMPKHRN